MGKYTLSEDNKILIRYEGEEKKVNIPECIMQIGEHAFENCIQLEEIIIPSNIKIIEEFAFSGCKNLKRVKLHDDISFENNVFYDCPSLLHDIVCNHKLIRVPMSYVWEYVVAKDINTIVGGAFQGCNGITNVLVYPKLKAIGSIKFDELISIQIGHNVAIAKKNEKYGAISLDGEDIVPAIYDELSDFEDGFTIAKYYESRLWGYPLINVEERLINISGQVLVRTDNGNALLPKEYDWGTDFINGLSIVVKNRKIGIIDINGHQVVPIGKYMYIYIKFDGLIQVSKDSFETEEKVDYNYLGIKQKQKETHYFNWGIIDSTGKELIPCKYSGFYKIRSFGTWSNDFLGVKHGNIQYDGYLEDAKVGVYSISRIKDRIEHVELIVPIAYDEVSALSIDEHQKPPFVIAKKGRCNDIFNLKGRLLLSYDNKYDSIVESSYYGKKICLQFHTRTYYITEKGVYYELKGCGLFKEENGELYLLGLQYSQKFSSWLKRTYSIECLDYIDGMIVERDYLSYRFYELGDDSLGVSCNNLCGIADKKGNIFVPIQYQHIGKVNDNCFISSKLNKTGALKYGIINRENEELFPFSYNYIGTFKDYLVYSTNVLIDSSNKGCSYDPKFFKDCFLFGIMTQDFRIITNPKYNKILDANKFCIKVSKDGDMGVIDLQGNEIFELGESDKLELMDNGLIKYALSLGDHYEWGAINYKGEDVIPCDYSAIEIINSNYLMVCSVDYERLYDDHYDLRYDDMGLWGVIDTEGNVILSCSYPKEFVADALGDKLNRQRRCSSGNQHQIEYGEHFNDSNKLDYKKDNVHSVWDDDTIDEAFEGETELTWNVD